MVTSLMDSWMISWLTSMRSTPMTAPPTGSRMALDRENTSSTLYSCTPMILRPMALLTITMSSGRATACWYHSSLTRGSRDSRVMPSLT